MTQKATIEHYCENTTKGNAVVVSIGDKIDIYFSYKTPIAFRFVGMTGPDGKNIVVRRNEWGPTTGKHLRAIDGLTTAEAEKQKARVSGTEFETILSIAIDRVFGSNNALGIENDTASALRCVFPGIMETLENKG